MIYLINTIHILHFGYTSGCPWPKATVKPLVSSSPTFGPVRHTFFFLCLPTSLPLSVSLLSVCLASLEGKLELRGNEEGLCSNDAALIDGRTYLPSRLLPFTYPLHFPLQGKHGL